MNPSLTELNNGCLQNEDLNLTLNLICCRITPSEIKKEIAKSQAIEATMKMGNLRALNSSVDA